MTIEIGYVHSNKAQVCVKCGKVIPARERSVKTTKKWRGFRSMTDTYYTCMDCEQKAEEMNNKTL